MGVGPVLTDIGEKVAGDAVKGFGDFLSKETGAYGFVRSTKALLEKTETGKIFSNFLEHTYEPKVRQLGQEKLTSKIASGVKPATAAQESIREAHQEVRKLFLGQNDEALIKAIHTATKKHGTIYGNAFADSMSVYFNDAGSYWRKAKVNPSGATTPISLKDVGIKGTSSYHSQSEIETGLRKGLSWMYTPLIAIPHVGQLANIFLDNSIKDVAKGLGEYFGSSTKDKFRADLIKSGALFDELRYEIEDDAKGGGIARKMFHHPGFGFVRRQEIGIAAASGKQAALDAASKISSNSNDRWSRYTLVKLGLNPDHIADRGGRLTEDEIRKVMYTEADRTIFLRSNLKTPWRWEESFAARMGSQYRHFQYRQTQFLSNVFKNSYKEGGISQFAKSVATFATLFPAFGELVHSVENMALLQSPLNRDPHHKLANNEYIDAMAHAAGFGVFYSMTRAGMFNGGKGYLEGPLFSTADDILIGIPTKLVKGSQYLAKGDKEKAKKQFKGAARGVVSKLGAPGRAAAEFMK